ncbi:aminotransferase class V-fold PLP-dependent enzyme [Phaeacidiphilus oryzae]|jgi:cysteine desulfurase/selenocysteine lyase|uniref:aminotransferase class V-fold PLP-dependent enzyme n=1 Tax=Phaeacidiphilus oryzae TaxID=348818 RepID=UPI000691F722|nr:cysteine desulfurase [Phaeacidiphilus oryzae]
MSRHTTVAPAPLPGAALDVDAVRRDFDLLRGGPDGNAYVYLDSASTSLTPRPVVDAITHYYRDLSTNIHRASYAKAVETTRRYEEARETVADFVRAEPDEIVFTANASAGLNLVARLLEYNGLFEDGGTVLTTLAEHHSNLLPWRRLGKEVRVGYIELLEDCSIDLDSLAGQLRAGGVRVVAVNHASNVTGTVNDLAAVSRLAREHGALVVVDGTQCVPHRGFSAQELDVDFLAFSAHKMLGPTGIGVLYAKKGHLGRLDPVFVGGGTVQSVSASSERPLDGPSRFEVGTPNISGALGLAAAVEYVNGYGMEAIQAHEAALTAEALDRFDRMEGVTLFGSRESANRVGTFSFRLDGVPADTVCQVLADAYNIATRGGHHCAQPLVDRLSGDGVCRMSTYLYNTRAELGFFFDSLQAVRDEFARV